MSTHNRFLVILCAVVFGFPPCRADLLYISEEIPPCINTCGQVVSLDTAGGTPQLIIPGSAMGAPYMARDNAVNIYTGGNDGTGRELVRTDPNGNSSVLVSDTGAQTLQMAADSAGNVWLTFSKGNSIEEVSPSGNVSFPFSPNILQPGGLAFDASGNLYVTDLNTAGSTDFPDAVYEFQNGSQSLFAMVDPTGAGHQRPFDLAFDPAGNLYVSYLSGIVEKFDPTGHDLGQFAFVSGARGLAVDSAGNLFVAGLGGTVAEFNPSGAQIFSANLNTGPNAGLPFNIAVSSEVATPEPGSAAMFTFGLLVIGAMLPIKLKLGRRAR